ncbi:hypothetical protein BDU57DRAFT_580321 [Ampelomyces quisqualis]|uniref:BRCT domain-containing protein n=1 Tax=Ampelomyces quisqualis TaxID=50730 RepID=A0A6A5QEL6_AMPQU|nr:hypothetical protein BDU57DRAFT_580321 [Ampelomyces quisqualis]
MVATRRGAQKAPEAAPAPANTLSAPPKRGGRKKPVVEEAAAKPAPATTKAPRTTATKRKAQAQPEDAEMPPAKKPAANTKAARAAKVEMKAEPAPAAPKRATRGKKAAGPEAVQEPAHVTEAPKPRATRGRKASVKTAVAPQVEAPVAVEEPHAQEPPKPAARGRKAPAKKTAATKAAKAPVVKETIAVEPPKPAPRARKAAAPKPSLPPPVAASRPTRGRAAAIVAPQESPLKAPARKPTNKAAAVAKPDLAPVEELALVEESAPAKEPTPVKQPTPVEEPFSQFPGYPTTPAHILAPLSSKDALAALPGYPTTPAHILAPLSSKDALAALPDYPTTPAHIAAPMATKLALAEMPGYPTTPAHITAPVLSMSVENKEVVKDLADHVNTHVHVDAMSTSENVVEELHANSTTPSHIQAPETTDDARHEPSGILNTPKHIHAPVKKTPMSSRKALAELPIDYVETPAHAAVAVATPSTIGLSKLPADCFATPAHVSSPVIAEEGAIDKSPAECFATPAHVSSPIIAEEGAIEFDEGPHTPQQLIWGVTNQEAFDELPAYLKTPSHIAAPDSLFDPMDIDNELPVTDTVIAQPMPKLQLAPVQLSASRPVLEMASPKKSALRSPQKFEAKTPKKAVTWDDKEESELFMYGGPLQGLTFFVDITSHGKPHNYVFASLLEDLGAKTVQEWQTGISHVLFKDGSLQTLEKVIASKGAVKCVNLGWASACEEQKKRVDEGPYLVDLSVAMPSSPLPTTAMNAFTPARTPSKYALPPSSQCKDIPTTPTSSEFDHSINDDDDDDKENSDVGLFFKGVMGVKNDRPRTCPSKKPMLFSRSAMKTPSKLNFLANSPVKPFSTGKKRTLESSSLGFSLSAPPKKLRLI